MQKMADGVWQLHRSSRALINVYLVEDVLIDAATRWAKRWLLDQLRHLPIRMVVLTHCHPDHQGCAKAVCERKRAPLACHEADVAAMEGRSPMLPRNWIIRLGEVAWAGPPYRVEKVLREGDEVAGFRVVHAPGHTPGHIVLFRESDRVALAGDLLANINFLTGAAELREPPWFFSFDPLENRRSLQKLIALQPRLVCFGHGTPLRNPELLEKMAARWDAKNLLRQSK